MNVYHWMWLDVDFLLGINVLLQALCLQNTIWWYNATMQSGVQAIHVHNLIIPNRQVIFKCRVCKAVSWNDDFVIWNRRQTRKRFHFDQKDTKKISFVRKSDWRRALVKQQISFAFEHVLDVVSTHFADNKW